MKLLNKINPQVGFNLLSIFVLWLIFMLFSVSVGYEMRVTYNITYFIGDAFLLCSPMWLMGRKGRWYAVAIIWILSILLIASALYYRYWGDLLPLSAIFNTSNWNHFVFEGAIPHISLLDVVIIAIAVAYTVMAVRFRVPVHVALSLRHKLIAFFGSIMVWLMTVCVCYVHKQRYSNAMGTEHNFSKFIKNYASPIVFNKYQALYDGITMYFVRQIRNAATISTKIELTHKQIEEIEQTLSLQARLNTLADTVATELTRNNKDKNLIFIIVESLNSQAIGHLMNGRSITPTLDSLLKTPGTIASTHMIPQIKSGGSSDGQLIYNTGLLPIESDMTVLQFDKNQYPSLAKLLKKKYSAEFIVESGGVWNHVATNAAFGYNRLYEKRDLESSGLCREENGDDNEVFTFALNTIKNIPQPFYAEITTLSMHFPFADTGVPEFRNGINDIDIEQRYYLSLKYFDSELNRFLDGLKRQGQYDNSIIVIASDHDVNLKDNANGKKPICFMALNTGITKRITTRTWQSDVFPTVLDIMGVDTSGGYRGLGHSLLSDSIPERDDAYWAPVSTVSDRIIRSDYFNRN